MVILAIIAVLATIGNVLSIGGLLLMSQRLLQPGSKRRKKSRAPSRQPSRASNSQNANVGPGPEYDPDAKGDVGKQSRAVQKALYKDRKVPVSPYSRRDGTQVSSHRRTEEVRVR